MSANTMMTNPSEFSLNDVVVGSTVMRGRSTAGSMVTGTVSRTLSGIGFRVVQENGQRSILWSSLALVPDATPVRVVSSPVMDMAPPVLARTDSGADYGILGFPDCAFWERNGANPLYLATSDHYDTVSGVTPGWRVKQLLQQYRCTEEEGAFRRAWDNQMAAAELDIANTPLYNVPDFMEPALSPPRRVGSPTTPFRQIAAPVATPPVATPPATMQSARMQSAVCPGAPVRPDRKISESLQADGVPTLVIPDVSDHKGKGILSGDFIKPDPLMTQQETRRYILTELERFLMGRVQRHALQIDAITPAGLLTDEMESLVSAGRWPAGRMYTLFAASPSTKRRQDPEIHMDYVARVALESCVKYLQGARDGSVRATGFVATDKLPNGHTIASYWDHSPFNGLRSAAPLADAPDLPLPAKAENLPLPGSPLLRQIAAPTPPFGAAIAPTPDMSPIAEHSGLELVTYEGKTYFLNAETGLVYSLRLNGMEQVAVKEGEMFVFLDDSDSEESESESESESETTDGEESEDEDDEVSDSAASETGEEDDSDGDSATSETEEEDSDSDYVPADSVDADGHVEGWGGCIPTTEAAGGTLRPNRLQTLRPLPHRVASTTQVTQGPQGIDERIDSRIDAWTATFGRFVQAKYTFTISGANILSIWFAITVYLWIINFMLAGRR